MLDVITIGGAGAMDRRTTVATFASAMIVALVTAVGIVASPAHAARWDFTYYTTDAKPGGRTWGYVSYTASGSCYNTTVKGQVEDLEADGLGVATYVEYYDCARRAWVNDKRVGFAAPAGTVRYFDPDPFYRSNIKQLRVYVCLTGTDQFLWCYPSF